MTITELFSTTILKLYKTQEHDGLIIAAPKKSEVQNLQLMKKITFM